MAPPKLLLMSPKTPPVRLHSITHRRHHHHRIFVWQKVDRPQPRHRGKWKNSR